MADNTSPAVGGVNNVQGRVGNTKVPGIGNNIQGGVANVPIPENAPQNNLQVAVDNVIPIPAAPAPPNAEMALASAAGGNSIFNYHCSSKITPNFLLHDEDDSRLSRQESLRRYGHEAT